MNRLTVAILLALTAFTASACTEPTPEAPEPAPAPEPEPEPKPEPEPAPPSPPSPPHDYTRGPCQLGPALALGAVADARPTLAVRFGAGGGVLAYPEDATHVVVLGLSPEGAPVGEPHAMELPSANRLGPIFSLGDLYVLTSQGICASHMRKCVHLRAVDASGAAVGEALSSLTVEWMSSSHFAVAGDSLYLLRSHTYLPVALDRFTLGEGGAIERTSLLDVEEAFRGRELDPDMAGRGLAIDAEGERWAAYVEVHDSGSGRMLGRIFREGGRVVNARRRLAEGEVADMAFEDERLRVLLRPAKAGRAARVMYYDDQGGAEPVRALGADESISGDRTTGGHGVEEGQAYFTRFDRAGREVGPRLPLDESPLGVNGLGGQFLVYTSVASEDGAHTLTGRRVQCE